MNTMKFIAILIVFFICSEYSLYSQPDLNGNPTIVFTQDSENETISIQKFFKTESKHIPGIFNVIPSPTKAIADIAYDGDYLWVVGFNEYKLFKVSPLDGKVVKELPLEIQRPYGVAFDGECLWVVDNEKFKIAKIDTSDGKVLSTVSLPNNKPFSYPQGLAWDGEFMWLNDSGGSECEDPGEIVYKLNKQGKVVETFKSVSECPTGLTYDGTYLWSADNETYRIYKIDLKKFKEVNYIKAPGGNWPNGLAFDGTYLWVGNSGSDSLYQIDSTFIQPPQEPNVSVYPNPSKDVFEFLTDVDYIHNDYYFAIYNSMGQMVYHQKIEGAEFYVNLEDFKVGIFFYSIINEKDHVVSGKVIKI